MKRFILMVLPVFLPTISNAAYNPLWDTVATNYGTSVPMGRVFSSVAASATITQTNADQAFAWSSSSGSLTIPTAQLTVGSRWHIYGIGTVTGATLGVDTVDLKLKAGSVVLADGGAVTINQALAASRFQADCRFVVTATGSSGSVYVTGWGIGSLGGVLTPVFIPTPGSVTINTTTDQALTLTTVGGATFHATVAINDLRIVREY